jgi:hypothetical protein
MPTTERLTAADGPQGDDWAADLAPTKGMAASKPRETAEVRQARQRIAADGMGQAMHWCAAGIKALNDTLASGIEGHVDDLEYEVLAETVSWIQEQRKVLAEAEAYVARELGRMDGTPEIIELPDGRHAEVMKGKDRKEWRHDDWKRDVRAAVISHSEELAYLTFVNVDGEIVPQADALQPLLAAVQAVHGSAAPKVTALKPLGLSADDYCTTGPGPYSVRISAAPTTTQEN